MNEPNLRELQRRVHAIARSKGWWDDFPPGVPPEQREGGAVEWASPEHLAHVRAVIVLLALVTTEASEAIEEVRTGRLKLWHGVNGKPEGLPAELADVVIRCLDLAEGLGIDLAGAIEEKIAYNAGRTMRHGGKLA